MNIQIYLSNNIIIHVKNAKKVGFYHANLFHPHSFLRVWDANHKVIAEYQDALGWDRDL